jgi:uncharacterized protein (DUF342 family)
MSSNEIKMEYGLGFEFKADDGKLFAVLEPYEDKIELTSEIIKQRLEDEQLAYLFINEHSIFDLIRRYNHAAPDETFEIEIGERRDATYEIKIDEGKMNARLILTPSFGGKVVSLEDVQNLLRERKIVWGIVPTEVIENALAKASTTNLLIAEGLEPVAGVDAQFVSSMPEAHERKPMIDEDGSVDYRELGDIVIVHKDDVLMQRIPPVEGKKGRNILGEIINPKGGADTPFSSDKKGVYLNPTDGNQLLSEMTGQPIPVPNGMIVTPVLTVKNVDFASGNIRFDGSVIVQGDVEEGMKVYALEDITIDGSVVDAQIECMGNLLIKGGVTGNSQLIANGDIIVKGGVQGQQETTDVVITEENDAKIVTHGSVMVGFSENFRIEAGVDIVVDKYVLNSHLMAENKIVAGAKNSGKKSSIMGGITWAMMLVKGAILGASSGIKTHIQVGSNPYLHQRIVAIREKLIPNEKEQKDIHKILEFVSIHPEKGNPEMLEKLHHTLSKLIIEADLCHAEQKELVANMGVIDAAKVVAERGVYTGTEVQINSVLWKAQENRGKSVFRVEHREMTINNN